MEALTRTTEVAIAAERHAQMVNKIFTGDTKGEQIFKLSSPLERAGMTGGDNFFVYISSLYGSRNREIHA